MQKQIFDSYFQILWWNIPKRYKKQMLPYRLYTIDDVNESRLKVFGDKDREKKHLGDITSVALV